MTIEEKKKIARNFYDKLELTDYTLESKRDDEINSDFVWIPDMRGPGGLIIDDNGSYLFCQSMHDYNYWKEEYKKGERTHIDESLRLRNGKYAVDEETKRAFDEYMKEVDEYNRKVENGEDPGIKLDELLDKYHQLFYDEELEEKLKKIKEDFANRKPDTSIADLIAKIDKKLEEINDKQE